MANDFSNILPILQDKANVVGRELTGFVNASYRNVSAERAAKDQDVKYPIVPALASASVTPAATSPAGTDITPTSATIEMTNLKGFVELDGRRGSFFAERRHRPVSGCVFTDHRTGDANTRQRDRKFFVARSIQEQFAGIRHGGNVTVQYR